MKRKDWWFEIWLVWLLIVLAAFTLMAVIGLDG
jgi:hypothetical protein